MPNKLDYDEKPLRNTMFFLHRINEDKRKKTGIFEGKQELFVLFDEAFVEAAGLFNLSCFFFLLCLNLKQQM